MELSKKSKRLVSEMEKHGYYFDAFESSKGNLCFTIVGIVPMYFTTWKELEEYLRGVCWE